MRPNSVLFPVLLIALGMIVTQTGASFAKMLFPLVGAAGATTLRLTIGAGVLIAGALGLVSAPVVLTAAGVGAVAYSVWSLGNSAWDNRQQIVQVQSLALAVDGELHTFMHLAFLFQPPGDAGLA